MTRLGDRIPVERLDPARLDRIERQVLTAYRERALDPRPRRFGHLVRWLVPAVAVAGVAFAVFLNLRGAAAPQPQAATVAAPPQMTSVDTRTDGQTRLELGDAVVVVAADTQLEIERDDSSNGAITIALRAGSVDCEVAPRGDRPPFVVRAGEVAVTVVGTGFRVERSASGDQVRVAVRHGRVRVDAIGGSVSVAAGEDWSGPATRVAAATPAPEPTTDEPPEPEPPVEDPQVAMRPHHVAPPAPAHPSPAGAPARPESAAEERAARLEVRPQRRRPDTTDAPALAAIMQLEESDPKAAIRKYQELALSEGGDTARFALYSMAHVQYFQLHQRKAAISTARRFENRFPSGRYAEDVLWLRIRATCELAVDEECRAAAHAYLESFPHGAYADRAREIITWM